MNAEQRIETIKQRLEKKFSPERLEVIDDSQQHRGHAGSQQGAGHYTIVIAADGFKQQSRVAIHRAIYQELTDLIPDEIHALRINVLPLNDR